MTRLMTYPLLLAAMAAFAVPLRARGQEVSFEPILLPIAISWSPKEGASVSLRGPQVLTPLGRFSVRFDLAGARRQFPGTHVLLVVVGDQSFVYDLGDESFVLELPNNLEGRSTLTYDGRDIFLRIPHPDRLGPPKQNRGAERQPSVSSGEITLRNGECYSFVLGAASGGNGELCFSSPSLRAK